MDIKIILHYHTVWGESLVLRVGKRRYQMRSAFAGVWQAELTGRNLRDGDRYSFEVQRDGKTVRTEWRAHLYCAPEKAKSQVIRERWTDRPVNSSFYSYAFSDVIFRRHDGASFRHPRPAGPVQGNVTFRVAVPEVRTGESVALAGSGKALGDWKEFHLLDDGRFPYWQLDLDVKDAFEYKFVIVDTETRRPLVWEEGPNHFFGEVPAAGSHVVVADIDPQFLSRPWRGAGVAVPVFSLRTEDSFGVGEFHDIKKLVDWAVATGQSIIQLLPINDTTMTHTWQDSYPYNAVSSFALHPMYIHLPDAGIRKDAAYKARKEELESLPAVDYEAVTQAKLGLLRKLFKSAKGQEACTSAKYKAFMDANEEWLLPYAVFSVLRDRHGSPDFSAWGEWSGYDRRKALEFAKENAAEVDFYCFLQYLLDKQLKEAVAYAHLHGVALKGDLPIGVSRVSVDAWQHPELFHMDSQAGAPPDAFAADGQNWGFPTYNWEKMEEDGFAWWKARMRKMAEYFDAFRIDHILGFFRIWEIPVPYKSGLMGHFNPALPYSGEDLRNQGFNPVNTGDTDVLFVEDPRHKDQWHPRISAQFTNAYAQLPEWLKDRFNALYNDFFYRRHNEFWKESAYRKLPALLRSTGMLCCGEDLGMIPDSVPETMRDLDILSLEIQRMPKDPRDTFADPSVYPYACVCATGTHDTAPLRAWWEEDRKLTQTYYNTMLHCAGEAPQFCEPWVADLILGAHLKSPAMLAILPLQDWLATDGDVRYPGDPKDERINVPAIPRYYWRYRMHCTLESLIGNEALNAHIKGMVVASGRNR